MKANIVVPNNMIANVNGNLANKLNASLSLNSAKCARAVFTCGLKRLGIGIGLNEEISSVITSSEVASQTNSVVTSTYTIPINNSEYSIGKTVLGRDIMVHKLGDVNNPNAKKILLVSGIHGCEGYEVGDTQYFKQMLLNISNYYKNNPSELDGVILYVIPCVNIDGMLCGNTGEKVIKIGDQNEIEGRCNANGYDLNRCFSELYVEYTTPFNYNVGGPFAPQAKEAIILRDFVISIKPDFVIDTHGYENKYKGNYELCKLAQKAYKLPISSDWTVKSNGYFSSWCELSGNAKAALLYELPPVKGNVYDFFKEQEGYLLKTTKNMAKKLTGQEIEKTSSVTASVEEVKSEVTSSKEEQVTSVETSSIMSSVESSTASSVSSTIGLSNYVINKTNSIAIAPEEFTHNKLSNEMINLGSTITVLAGTIVLLSVKIKQAIKNKALDNVRREIPSSKVIKLN